MSVTVGESKKIVLACCIAVSSSITVSENVDAQGAFRWTQRADAATVTDAPQIHVPDYKRDISDSVGVADVPSARIEPLLISPQDTVTVDESIGITRETLVSDFFISKTETVTLAEYLPTHIGGACVYVEEQVTVTAETPAAGLSIGKSESVAVGESIGKLLDQYHISEAETSSVTDAPALQVPGPGLLISVYDRTDVGDPFLDFQPEITDSTSITENIGLGLGSYIDTQDSITLGEYQDLQFVIDFISVTDSITATDSPQVVLDLTISTNESATIAENIPTARDNTIVKSESVTVQENIAIEKTGVVTHFINKQEDISLQDVISAIPDSSVIKSDSVGVAESIDLDIHLEISKLEAISVSETIKIGYDSWETITESESVSLNESVNVLREAGPVAPLSVVAAEAITLAEAAPRVLYAPDLQIIISDNLSLEDILTKRNIKRWGEVHDIHPPKYGGARYGEGKYGGYTTVDDPATSSDDIEQPD